MATRIARSVVSLELVIRMAPAAALASFSACALALSNLDGLVRLVVAEQKRRSHPCEVRCPQ